MSDITLSASVRQNLLSLQSTSQLLATTQERLATGNKVNSALDNPTNFFTAQSLNNRASDISNLLDSVGNGVQVLQAANTGITSLQKLIDSAKSVANQALQATSGYTTKSQIVSTTINGATAGNLLGTATYSDVVAETGSAVTNNTTGAAYNNSVVGKTVDNDQILGAFDGTAITPAVTAAATITGTTNLSGALSTAGFAAGQTFSLTVGSTTKTFEFYDTNAGGTAPTNGNVGIDLNGTTATGTTLAGAITTAFGAGVVNASIVANHLNITTAAASPTALTDSITLDTGTTPAGGLGVTGGTYTATPTSTPITETQANVLAAKLNGPTTNVAGGVSGISAGDSFTINGKTVSFASSGGSAVNALTGGQIDLSTATVQTVVDAINTIAGGTVATIGDGTNGTTLGALHIDATQAPVGINVSLANTSGSPLAAFGVTGPVNVSNTGTATSTTGITAASLLSDTASSTSTGLGSAILSTDTLTVGSGSNTYTIAFNGADGGTTFDSTTNTYTMDLTTATVGDVLNTIDKITGTYGTSNASTISNGQIHLSTGNNTLTLSDSTSAAATGNNRGVLAKLGLDDLDAATAGDGATTPVYASATQTIAPSTSAATAITGATSLTQAAGPTSNGLASGFTASDSITVDGKTISFSATAATDLDAGVINLGTGTVQNVLDAIDKATGTFGTANASSIDASGKITLHTGTTSDFSLSGAAGTLAKLGLTATAAPVARQANSTLSGLTLNIGATDGGSAVSITFGSAAGQVDSLDELNAALKDDNLEASLDTTGKLTITTTNDHSAATIGAISGTAVTQAGSPFAGAAVAGPVANTDSQNSRASLVAQYNNIIDQIRTTAQDASFNGVNLLNGDKLSLVFNETGTSKLDIQGVTDDPSGLGLSALTAGTDFLDNSSANKILASLNSASSILRSQGSTLGSNLSVVQIRQDFSNNLINVLQTGASNLTLADTNEEAANSQALSTRQSIAVSALALANQSQQSVLRLLQ